MIFISATRKNLFGIYSRSPPPSGKVITTPRFSGKSVRLRRTLRKKTAGARGKPSRESSTNPTAWEGRNRGAGTGSISSRAFLIIRRLLTTNQKRLPPDPRQEAWGARAGGRGG